MQTSEPDVNTPLLSRPPELSPSHPPDSSSRLRRLFPLFLPFLVVFPLFYALTARKTATLSLSDTHPNAHGPSKPSITLAALGDWGRRGRFGQTRVANAMATFIHDTATEAAVISTGDNFYKVGVESAMDDHFNASFESVYKHVSLQTLPWYAVLGNHDHFGSVHAQTAYTLRSERWRMPGTYYTQQLAPNLLAIFLDTSPFVQDDAGEMARGRNKQDPQAQLKWFQAVLREAAPEKYFLIVGHHNMYTMSTGDHLGTKEIRDAFEPIIKPYQKRLLAYVSGHEHSLMHMQPYEGVIVDHFLSGAGSKITDIVEPSVDEREKWYKCCGVLPLLKKSGLPRTVWGAAKHGFFTFTFDGTTFSAKAIDEGNNVLYEYEKNVGIS